MGGAQRPLGCRSRKRVGDRCVSWCQKGSLGSKPLRGMEQVSMVPAHPKLEGRWLDPVGGRAWTKPHGSPSSRVAAPHISRRFQTGQSSAGAFQVAEVARGCDATGPGRLFQAQGTRPHEVSGRARPAARSGGEKGGGRPWRCAGSRDPLPRPSAARSRSRAPPAAPLVGIPPAEASAAPCRRRGPGMGAQQGSGPGSPRGRRRAGDREQPSRSPFFPGWGLCQGRGMGGTMRGPEAALGPGARAVNGARCRGWPGEGTWC